MIVVPLDDEVREYAREAQRFGLWVWAARPNHIAFGQPFVPPFFFSGGKVVHYWADRAALYGDAASREPIFLKIGLAVARSFETLPSDERRPGLYQLNEGGRIMLGPPTEEQSRAWALAYMRGSRC